MSRTEMRRRNFIQRVPVHDGDRADYDSGDYDKTLDQALEDARLAGRVREAAGRGAPRAASCSGAASRPTSRSAAWRRQPCPRARPHAGRLGELDGPRCTQPARSRSSPAPRRTARATPRRGRRSSSPSSAIPFDDVEVIHGDTAFAPYGLGTYGSRSLAVGGTAVYRAAGKLRDKAKAVAAHMLEASPDDLEFDGGTLPRQGQPRQVASTIREVAFRAWQGFDMPEGYDAGAGRDGLLRPAELHLPVRRTRLRGGGRQGDRQSRDRAATSRLTTAAMWSTR